MGESRRCDGHPGTPAGGLSGGGQCIAGARCAGGASGPGLHGEVPVSVPP